MTVNMEGVREFANDTADGDVTVTSDVPGREALSLKCLGSAGPIRTRHNAL